MNKSKSSPVIRFKDFHDDWEQLNLGPLVNINSGWSPSNFSSASSNQGELFIKVDDLNYSSREQTDSKLKVADTSRFKKMKKGSVIFPKRGAAIMTNKVRILTTDAFMDTNMMALEPLNIDSSFLYTFIDRTGLYKIADTSTVPQINNKHIIPYNIVCPNITEQNRIGLFFKMLDNIISLHQHELTLLKQRKKAFLQKMFPKKGESVPEIRFKGFVGAWENRKLDSIFEKIRNAFVGTASPYYVKNGNFYLESNNIKDGKINRTTEVFINDEFYEKQRDKWLHTNDLVMVQSGHVGHTAVIPPDLNNTAAHAVIMFQNYLRNTNPYFLNFQFQTITSKKNLYSITTGNTIKHILSSEMKKFNIQVTTQEEEHKIGNFFKQLDEDIALHEQKLEKLKEMKKAFLQKMFV